MTRCLCLLATVVAVAAVLAPAAAETAERPSGVPHPRFLWGVCQAFDGPRGDVFPLTRAELLKLRDELRMNALRFWVHPRWIGIPQQSFVGPEVVDYTRPPLGGYVWRDPSPAIDSLDEVLDLLRDLRIHPVLMIFPVMEYAQYLPLEDLTFLNKPAQKLDYTGIRPAAQLKALSAAIAAHVHERCGGDFSLIHTELAGGTELGAPKRLAEGDRWAGIARACREAAPGATLYSPELAVSLWWWGAARSAYDRLGRSAPPVSVEYTDTWPPADRIERFRDAFDSVGVVYFGMSPANVERLDVAPDRTPLQAATDPLLWTIRENVRPKRWMWAEAPWGARLYPPFIAHEATHHRSLLHRDYATLLFGMDHCQGALLWEGKEVHPVPAYTGEGGIFALDGSISKVADYPLLKAVSQVVAANESFFTDYHSLRNDDGFPVARKAFVEGDPDVHTRLLDRHLLLFSEAPTLRTLRLRRTGGARLREVPTGAGYSRKWTLTIAPTGKDALVVKQIRPGVLYLLEVLR